MNGKSDFVVSNNIRGIFRNCFANAVDLNIFISRWLRRNVMKQKIAAALEAVT